MALHTPVSPQKLARDIRALGVGAGDAVMVHASLRAIGPVVRGAAGVLEALDSVVGPEGGVLMVLGALNEWAWVNDRPEAERDGLLAGTTPFDAEQTPADPDVGYLAEALRQRAGTIVSNNPEGRFGARGGLAPELLQDAPWNDYFGPGSPLERLCELDGYVLRIGADPDTVTLLHYAEYIAPLAHKRRVKRHRCVQSTQGAVIRTIECLDDSEGIVEWDGEDYFTTILTQYLEQGRASRGTVGNAGSELIGARDLVDFAVRWMCDNLLKAHS